MSDNMPPDTHVAEVAALRRHVAELEAQQATSTAELKQRSAELAIINSVQQALVQQLDMQAISRTVGDKIREIFSVEVVGIELLDEQTRLLHPAYYYDKGYIDDLEPLAPGEGLASQVLATPLPLVLNTKEEMSSYGVVWVPDATGKADQTASYLGVPIIVGERVLGMVSLQSYRQYAFDGNSVRLLTTLAASMGVALENARLFEETRRLLAETEERNAELAIINSVGEAMTRQLDVKTIARIVGDKVREIFNVEVVDIELLDQQTQLLHAAYYYDNGYLEDLEPLALGEGLASIIIKTRQPLVFGTGAESDQLGAVNVPASSGGEQDRNESYLGVPIIVGKRVIGAVSVQSYRQHAFDENSVRLLSTLSANMGVALENARLFEETRHLLAETEARNAELAIINSVGEAMARQLDVKTIARIVGDKVREIFHVETTHIALFNPQTNLIVDAYYYDNGYLEDLEPLALGEGLASIIINTRQPLVFGTGAEADLHGSVDVPVGSGGEKDLNESYLGVPIIVGERVIGVVSVQSYRPHAFDDNSVRLLSTLSANMGVALENARLFEAERARAEDLALVNRIGQGLAQQLELDALVELVGETLRETFDAQNVYVALHDQQSGLISFLYDLDNDERTYGTTIPFGEGVTSQIISSRQPLLLNYATQQQFGEHNIAPIGTPARSFLGVPIMVGERAIGAISVQNTAREGAYDENDLRLLTTIAANVGAAIENARLFEETKRLLVETEQRNADLATVNTVSKAIVGQLELDALVELVGDTMRATFAAQTVYVALYDQKTGLISFPYDLDNGERLHGSTIQFGEGLTSQIIHSRQPLLINYDAEYETLHRNIAPIGSPSRSLLGVPIMVGEQAIGVISVQNTEREGAYDENDLRLLTTIAANVGAALQNARLFEELMTTMTANIGAALENARLYEEAREAREAAETKSSFLANVSHELRTPLTSVLGFAKIIKKRLDEVIFPSLREPDAKVQRAMRQVNDNLQIIVAEGERLTTMINDVLDLAKIEAGKVDWNMAPLAIGEVVAQAAGATEALFSHKGLPLLVEVAPDLPPVVGDYDRLVQVVINLLSNAVKFTDHGQVVCRAALGNGELLISVSDTGPGIAPEDHAKVFEQFKQVGDTLTDKPKGTGLGLPISKQIVERHGGRIWLDSTPGQGSTFTFSLSLTAQAALPSNDNIAIVELPVLAEQLRVQIANGGSHDDAHAPLVLVVDDDARIRELLRQELDARGYGVQTAANGRTALETVRATQPSLIILDVLMPELSGFDVVAVLKSEPATATIPIIMLTVVEQPERGYRLGVDRYFTKPFDADQVIHEVGVLVERGLSS
jgi:GAF domain-containing protein/CheY-like chemotaxis protein